MTVSVEYKPYIDYYVMGYRKGERCTGCYLYHCSYCIHWGMSDRTTPSDGDEQMTARSIHKGKIIVKEKGK